ncbi:ligand-dependent nuclear receptor-interacting factor 1 [Betta splendens]|uniref:Ligand-dependent nuclear receptor-interacting factor 1 n=1 Tax=Betta splendens TaxID=158456 RepID=A0A6P7N134_BETSP|nr:ligand-dependent nuclear receptor-interacting factor 1 [Betta splendens]
MYPANKDRNAAQSGTGMYYQAVPAVAANGKNIMKLIPVQMVNGQFFQTDKCHPRTDSTPQRRLPTNMASAPVQVVKKTTSNPPATQKSCTKTFTSANHLDHGYSQNKRSLQPQVINLTAKDYPIATPSINCDKPVRRPCRLPVTVMSPALPKGHHILIPPDAEVQTLPASDLPPGIKKHICISSESNLNSVVFVSPVTTIIQRDTLSNDSATDSVSTANKTLHASQSKRSKPYLKLIPKVSQRPNSPIKWVIEEEESPTAPNWLNPDSSPVISDNMQAVAMRSCDFIQKSSSVASKILRSLAERENKQNCDDSEKAISQSVLGGKGEDNALVIHNGKVFFMAKKCSLPFKMDQSDPATSAKHELNRTTLPSSQQSVEPVINQTQQEVSIVIPDDSDDIIDLCDDDDSTQQQTSVDEDNVIFVSYIPPKAELASQINPTVKSQIVPEKETTIGTKRRDVEEECLDVRPVTEDKDEDPALRRASSVCCSSVGEQETSTQQVESINVDVDSGNPVEPNLSASSKGTCSEKEKDMHIMRSSTDPTTYHTSSLAPKSCRTADHLLRRKFGITTDVNIRLQRVDETSAWPGLAHTQDNKFTINANSLQGLGVSCKKRETDYHCVKKARLLNGSEFSASPDTPALHTTATLKNKCPSDQPSVHGSSCGVEPKPEFGYVAPIDEDFLSGHEDDILKVQTCVELNTKTRRLGRTRKRTMCPCCSTGTLEHEADRLA